jgi:cyclopropane fatty-acyl-phospholipid synthase-like methyltransferase
VHHGSGPFDVLASSLDRSDAVARWGAAAYDRYVGQLSHTSVAHVELLAGAAAIGAGSRVLELGCGSGGFACHLALSRDCSVVGYDWSEAAIAIARERAAAAGLDGGVDFQVRDLDSLEPVPESADVVAAIDSLQFATDLPVLCETIARTLVPGGRLAAIATVTPGDDGDPHPLGVMSRAGLRGAFRAAGFSRLLIEDVTQSYTRLVSRMARCWSADLDSLERDLGPELVRSRLAEDEAILRLLEEGRLARLLVVASG